QCCARRRTNATRAARHPRANYDVPASVLNVPHRAAVRHVSILGRRGPLQAALTTKELRELMTLPSTFLLPLAHDVVTSIRHEAHPPPTPPPLQHTRQTLLPRARNFRLDDFRSLTGFMADGQHLILAHAALDENACDAPNGHIFPPTDLVVTAPWHHPDPLLPYYDPMLGQLRTDRGRVLDTASRAVLAVLAATMIDAYAVADAIMGNHFGDGPGGGGEVVPVQGEAYSNNVLVSEDKGVKNVKELGGRKCTSFL
ncbi:hypothetical protein BJV77DRAFT_1034193, partial [Russula vinacea]